MFRLDRTRLDYARGFGLDERFHHIALGEGVVGRAARDRRTVETPDILLDPRDRALAGDAHPGRVLGPPRGRRGAAAGDRPGARRARDLPPRRLSPARRGPGVPGDPGRPRRARAGERPTLRRDPSAPGDGRGARRHHADPDRLARPPDRARGSGGRCARALRGGRGRDRPDHPARHDAARRPGGAGRGRPPLTWSWVRARGAPAGCSGTASRSTRPTTSAIPGSPGRSFPRSGRRASAGCSRSPFDCRTRSSGFSTGSGAVRRPPGRAHEPGDRSRAGGGGRGGERAALPGSAGPGGRGPGPVRGRPADQLHPGPGPGLRSDRRAGARAHAGPGVRDLPARSRRPAPLCARGGPVAGVRAGDGRAARRRDIGAVRGRAPAGLDRRDPRRGDGGERPGPAAGRARGVPGRPVRADSHAGRALRLPGDLLVGAPRAHRGGGADADVPGHPGRGRDRERTALRRDAPPGRAARAAQSRESRGVRLAAAGRRPRRDHPRGRDPVRRAPRDHLARRRDRTRPRAPRLPRSSGAPRSASRRAWRSGKAAWGSSRSDARPCSTCAWRAIPRSSGGRRSWPRASARSAACR